jgi:ribosomal protein L37AE/L43A
MGAKDAYKLTDMQVFSAYRKFVLQTSQCHQLPKCRLEKGERLAILDGIWAVTPNGTVIDGAAHQKYTEGKGKTFYFVGKVNDQKMLAVQWNSMTEAERMEILGINNEGFHFIPNETVWCESIGNEEQFVEWAMNHKNEAHKLEEEYLLALHGINDEALLKAMTVKLHLLTSGVEPRYCAKCGRKLAKINDGGFCFRCSEEMMNDDQNHTINELAMEEVH